MKRTSNNQPGNIISNVILRSQIEGELKAHVYGEHGKSRLKEQVKCCFRYVTCNMPRKKHFHKKQIHKKISARLTIIFRNCGWLYNTRWMHNMATNYRRCWVSRFKKCCSSRYASYTSLSSLEFATGTDITAGTMATLYS